MINRTPSSIHHGRSPFEILHGVKPNYQQLQVFGSTSYTHRMTRDKDKFIQRSRLCIFIGYCFGKKGGKVYDIERNEFLVFRDIVFQEHVFPFVDSIVSLAPLLSPTEVFDDD